MNADNAPRLSTKFALGLGSCPRDIAAPAGGADRAARQAQQLYLYEIREPAPTDALPAPLPGDEARPATKLRRDPRVSPAVLRMSTNAQRALRLAPTVDATARAHDIDPLLLHAIVRVESRHDAAAVSPAGALGVMQVMPATASRFGVTPARALFDAPTNMAVGAAYLKTLQRRFGNDLSLVLAAYNAGEGAVERHGRRIPPYAETRAYVRDVLAEYARLRRIAGSTPGFGAMGDALGAERRARATTGPLRGPAKPAPIPSGDRPTYSSDEGPTS